MSAKATKAESDERTEAVENWLLEGKTRSTILHNASSWNIGDRAVELYITKAWERIKEVNAASREQNVARTLKRLDRALYRAIQKEDIKAEAKVIEIQAKILGLFEYTINHKYEDIPLPTHDLVSKLSELEPKVWN